jgi:hypothetical protein
MNIKPVKTSDDFLENIKKLVYNKNPDIIELYYTITEFKGSKNRESQFYKDKIDISIKELNEELNKDIINKDILQYNLVKITYYLSKIYNSIKIKEHENYVKSILKDICDMNLYSRFEKLFNMIHKSKRYDYDTLIPIGCNKNLNIQNEELESSNSIKKSAQNGNSQSRILITYDGIRFDQEEKKKSNPIYSERETEETEEKESLIKLNYTTGNTITTTKIEPPKILVITYDEDRKKFSIYQGKYIFKEKEEEENDKDYYLHKIYKKIKELNPDLVVCCTQNSLSCTEDHFQHYFKDFMKNKSMKYSLISKADATTKNDSSILSCSTKFFNESKPYNVRTRVYGNDDTLYVNLLDPRMREDSASGTYDNKFIYDKWYSPISGEPPINKFYLKYIGFRRITEDSKGLGGIIYDIMICKESSKDIGQDTTCFQNIFCNYNLGDASSKKILDAVSINKESFFKNTNYNWSSGNIIKIIKNELQIFMITPDSVKTKKLLLREQINKILVKNYLTIKRGRTKPTLTNIRSFFNKIDPTKINNNIKQKEEYQAKNKNKKEILKKLKIFNT